MFTCLDYAHQLYVGNKYTNDLHEGVQSHVNYSTIRSALGISGLIGIGKFLVLLILGAVVAPEHVLIQALPIIWVNAFISGPLGMLMQLYRPHGEYARGATLSILINIFCTIGTMVAVPLLDLSVVSAVQLFAIIKGIGECTLFTLTAKRFGLFGEFTRAVQWGRGVKNLRGSTGHLVNAGMEFGVNQGSIVLLERSAGGTETGLYATCRTIANIVLQNVGLVLFPIIHDFTRLMAQKDGVGFRALIWAAGACLGALTVVAASFLIAFGEPIFLYWTRGKFGPPGMVLAALACSCFLRVAFMPVYVIFQQLNHATELSFGSLTRLLLFGSTIALMGPSAPSLAAAAAIGEAGALAYFFWRWRIYTRSNGMMGMFVPLRPLWVACAASIAGLSVAPRGYLGGCLMLAAGVVLLLVAYFTIDPAEKKRLAMQIALARNRIYNRRSS